MIRPRRVLLPSFLLVCMHLCFADTVSLDNGSRLIGRVVSIDLGKVSLETDFAGIVSLPLQRVIALQTDAPVRVCLPDGKEATGRLSIRSGNLEIHADGSPTRVALAGLPKEQPAKSGSGKTAAGSKRQWSYEVSGNYCGKSGNTDSSRLGLGGKAIWKRGPDQLKIYATWTQAEQNQQETENETIGGGDLERQVGKRHSWYARTELEMDESEQLSLRATTATGYGYHLIKTKEHELRLRGGLQYRRENYDYDREDTDSLGLETGLRQSWQLPKVGKLVNDVTYSSAFDNWRDYRIVHESSLDVPLAKSQIWKLRLGLSHEYNSLSAPDTEDLDTTYFLKLVFNWK